MFFKRNFVMEVMSPMSWGFSATVNIKKGHEKMDNRV